MIGDLTFHHHGLALRQDGDALTFLRLLGYEAGEQVYDPVQDVRLRLCTRLGWPSVEIVLPGDRPGPLDGILRKHDQLLYHSCYETSDRASVLDEIERSGLRAIEVLSPKPAVLFGGRLVSFHTVLGFGLIELLDRA